MYEFLKVIRAGEFSLVRLLKSVKNHNFLKSVSTLLCGNLVLHLLGAMTYPVLARLYTPHDFGILSIFNALLIIMSHVITLGYEWGIPLTKSDLEAKNLFIGTAATVVIFSFIVLGLVDLIGKTFVDFLKADDLMMGLWFLPASLLAAGMCQSFQYWYFRKEVFTVISAARIAQGVGLVITQILLGLANVSSIGLIAGDFLGRLTASLFYIIKSLKTESSIFQGVTIEGIKKTSSEYRFFSMINAGAGLLNLLPTQFTTLVLVYFYGIAVGGYFSIAQMIAMLVANLVGSAIANVYISKLSILVSKSSNDIKAFFFRTAWSLVLIGVIPAFVLACFGKTLVVTLLGNAWAEAGDYVRVLSFSGLTATVAGSLYPTLNIMGRQNWQLVWTGLRSMLLIGVVVISYQTGLNSLGCVFAYSLVSMGFHIAHLYLSILSIRTHKPSSHLIIP